LDQPPRGVLTRRVQRRLEAVAAEYSGALPLPRLSDQLMRISRWRTELYPCGCPWDWTALADGLELLARRRILNPLAYATQRKAQGKVNLIERLGREAHNRRIGAPTAEEEMRREAARLASASAPRFRAGERGDVDRPALPSSPATSAREGAADPRDEIPTREVAREMLAELWRRIGREPPPVKARGSGGGDGER